VCLCERWTALSQLVLLINCNVLLCRTIERNNTYVCEATITGTYDIVCIQWIFRFATDRFVYFSIDVIVYTRLYKAVWVAINSIEVLWQRPILISVSFNCLLHRQISQPRLVDFLPFARIVSSINNDYLDWGVL